MNDDIRTRLRQRRKALGLTQHQLAKMIDVTNMTVYFWETGRVRPWETLAKMAAALGVTVDWLLTGQEPSGPPMKIRKVTTLPEMRAVLKRNGHSESIVAEDGRRYRPESQQRSKKKRRKGR